MAKALKAGNRVSWNDSGTVMTGKYLGTDEFGNAAVKWMHGWVISVSIDRITDEDNLSPNKCELMHIAGKRY